LDREGKPLPLVLHPQESWQRFYDEEKRDLKADPWDSCANPWDSCVVAWFDDRD
jgi:hypothetical protein